MGELKPCPFCSDGGKPELWIGSYDAHVFCAKCGMSAKGSGCGFRDDMARAAIKNWNTRYERTCGEPRGFIPYDRDNFGHPSFAELWCEHCDIELDPEWEYCPHCGAKVVEP